MPISCSTLIDDAGQVLQMSRYWHEEMSVGPRNSYRIVIKKQRLVAVGTYVDVDVQLRHGDNGIDDVRTSSTPSVAV